MLSANITSSGYNVNVAADVDGCSTDDGAVVVLVAGRKSFEAFDLARVDPSASRGLDSPC